MLKKRVIVILGLNYKVPRRGPKYPIFDTFLWILAFGPIFLGFILFLFSC